MYLPNKGPLNKPKAIVNNQIKFIANVMFTLFTDVPLSTAIPLYYLRLIATPSTVDKRKH